MTFAQVLFFPLRLAGQALSVASGEGSWSLRDYERRLIETASDRLESSDKEILRRQLQSFFFVERLHQDRVTRIHFQWRDRVVRMHLPDDYGLAKLKVRSAGGTVVVSVGAFQGLIFSLSYKKPPKPIFCHPFEVLEAEYGGKADESVTEEIDRSEHGP